jgi:hypothetical protein
MGMELKVHALNIGFHLINTLGYLGLTTIGQKMLGSLPLAETDLPQGSAAKAYESLS